MEGIPPTTEDEEPQICTVFSSTPSSQSKTIFDTISFSVPKKESSVMSPTSPFSEDEGVLASSSKSQSSTSQGEQYVPPVPESAMESLLRDALSDEDANASSSQIQIALPVPVPQGHTFPLTESPIPPAMFESLTMSYMAPNQGDGESLQGISGESTPVNSGPGEGLHEGGLTLISKELEGLSLNQQAVPGPAEGEQDSPLPTANSLFADAPEVPFPIGSGAHAPVEPPNAVTAENIFSKDQNEVNPIGAFTSTTYSSTDAAYDAWIPADETRQILMGVATAIHAGTFFPDKAHVTTPGIIYKDDLVDKVSVNMSRIFGEIEASKRQILTADSVTQDDNGIRELIKLGCYRSAINLTKRLLTLYGQGHGKVGQYSKHSPHSLQIWMTRIALLVRIREFKIAESELEAFNNFENPDMYYEFYQDSFGQGRKGSMIPFYFRLIAAEIPQYASKDYNGSADQLTKILLTIQKIIKNLNDGISEDGSPVTLDSERRDTSLSIWKKREIRVLYSLVNAFLLAKDFPNAVRQLGIVREKDIEKRPQLTSAIGRLFLQYGDLTTSQKYFKEAAAMRSGDTEVERVENLVDASLYFVAQGSYADAFGLLKDALVLQPDNFMITNNMAVCLLYMGKVKESLALMETTMRNNTPQLIQENVILNLSTIYELENSDGFKKNSLLKLISEYKGDGINLASLKMPNLI